MLDAGAGDLDYCVGGDCALIFDFAGEAGASYFGYGGTDLAVISTNNKNVTLPHDRWQIEIINLEFLRSRLEFETVCAHFKDIVSE